MDFVNDRGFRGDEDQRMSTPSLPFHESNLLSTPIRDLGLSIAGTPLAPVVAEFLKELEHLSVRPQPHVYLSTEWGVPFGTISIAIPFYLARPELTAVHGERAGYLEGVGRAALLRYLRHEMGHVVNYAYKLYDREDWVKLFGAITQPYEEEYRAEPFSRRFVVHLPGWYAQKHPDEDWAETFAVWMTPDLDWRSAYADWPEALAKLEYCDRTMAELRTREPEVTDIDPDEDVGTFDSSLEDFYREYEVDNEDLPHGLDGALRSIFEDLGHPEDMTTTAPRRPAAELIRRLEMDIAANVYRWTGHFPEYTRGLVRRLAERTEQLQQVYPADRETSAAVAVTALVTALAMNHVLRGSYGP
jgi:hypothetical protein